MSYAKLTSARLAGALPPAKGRGSLPDDDNWQSPQPLKPARPRLDVSVGVSALNKSAKGLRQTPTRGVSASLKAANNASV